MLLDYGFQIDDSGGGSHYGLRASISGKVWTYTIPRPHSKFVNAVYVKRIISYIDEIIDWLEQQGIEDSDDESSTDE